MTLEVLFEDQYYVAIHKPAGLLVHRTKLDSQESKAVVQILRNQIDQKVFPVHRLDRPTSGILIFAKSSESAQKLATEFANHKIEKRYLALVRGHFKQELFLDYPLCREIEVGHRKVIRRKSKSEADQEYDEVESVDNSESGQDAQTHFRPLASAEIKVQIDRYPTSRYSLVEAFPKTGRTHQIRRHLKHLSHPIIGDVNHGNGKHNRYFSEELKIKGLFLTCVGIAFRHPYSNKRIEIKSKLPSNFLDAFEKIGLRYNPAEANEISGLNHDSAT